MSLNINKNFTESLLSSRQASCRKYCFKPKALTLEPFINLEKIAKYFIDRSTSEIFL